MADETGTAVEFLLYNFLDLLDDGFGPQERISTRISKIKDDLDELNRKFKAQDCDDVWRYLAIRNVRHLGYRFDTLLESFILNNGFSPGPGKCLPHGFRRTRPSAEEVLSKLETEIESIKPKYLSGGDTVPFGYKNVKSDQGEEFYCEFVERARDMELLLPYNLCSDKAFCGRVITISGMVGVGKTRFAREMFRHPDVESHFRFRAWVEVPQKFQRGEILQKVLRQFQQQGAQLSPVEDMTDEVLRSEVLLYLEREVVLIVLDGVFSLDDLETLGLGSNEASRSKIVITMRRNSDQGEVGCVHLRNLEDDEGCKLLMSIPGFWDVKTPMSEDLLKKIVNFCEGLPSNIINFPGPKKTKHPTMSDWEKMVTTMLNYASSKRYENQDVRTLVSFASTYYELPQLVQPLFLYAGVLQQEDHTVEVEKLCLLSLADGLLEPLQREGKRLVHIAESHVTVAAQRSIVDLDEGEEPTITRFKHCKLNGLIRYLLLLINKEEGFLKAVGIPERDAPDSSSTSSGLQTLRAAVNLDIYEEGSLPLKGDEMVHIRVLLFSTRRTQVWPSEFSTLDKFKCLRILDFNDFDFRKAKLPKAIGRAVHLRYLSFKDCILLKLPSWVANLKLLCVLDLRVQQQQSSTKMIIPNVLWKLKKLVHLYFPMSFTTVDGSKLRLDGLTELETIVNFNASICNVEDLFGHRSLQYLHANVIENHVEDIKCIIKCMMLNSEDGLLRTSVKICNFDCYTQERESVYGKLLGDQSLTQLHVIGSTQMSLDSDLMSQNLTKIVFVGSEMMEDPIKTLEKLPKLRVLVLDNAFLGKEMVCSARGFVELRLLKIKNIRFLEEWVVEDGAMPNISNLAIDNCGLLEMLPEGIKFIRSLKELKIAHMSQEFKRRIREGKDRDKVRHVASIIYEE